MFQSIQPLFLNTAFTCSQKWNGGLSYLNIRTYLTESKRRCNNTILKWLKAYQEKKPLLCYSTKLAWTVNTWRVGSMTLTPKCQKVQQKFTFWWTNLCSVDTFGVLKHIPHSQSTLWLHIMGSAFCDIFPIQVYCTEWLPYIAFWVLWENRKNYIL